MTSIGTSTLQHTGTVAYDIPSVIPNSAKEVLVLASASVGISGPNSRYHYIKIYTEQDQTQYEKYIFLTSYNQNAYHTTNSDNLWFPMTSGRQVFVKLAYAHTGHVYIYLHAIGYRWIPHEERFQILMTLVTDYNSSWITDVYKTIISSH